MLIDSHCHFNHERFIDDTPAAIARALEAGVEAMVVVGFDMASSEAAVRLAATYPSIFAAVGVHPHDARIWSLEIERRLVELTMHPRVIAVGEIGFDYHYDFSPRSDQRRAFAAQLAMARAAGLPVIIHCRDAYSETLGLLAGSGLDAGRVVMHCWMGSPADAEEAVSRGMYLGFGGALTFKNAEDIRLAAQAVPVDRILIETDAPYLAPAPYRGKRNEPAYVALVAEAIARLRGTSREEVADITSANTLRAFPRMTACQSV